MNRTMRLAAAVVLALPCAVLAGPSDYVYTPDVEQGEREIDVKLGTWRFNDAGVRESVGSVGFGYGATSWWFTEAYLKVKKEIGGRARYDAFEWENKFQLTEPNRYAVDFGLITEIEIPRGRREEGYEIKIGALVQGDVGRLRWNANLLFERVLRGRSDTPRVTEIGYQLQAKYPVSPMVEVGAQALGEMGRWDHWEPREEQNNRLGPAIFGKVKLSGRESIKYNAAWLIGATRSSPDNTIRLQAEYEF